MPYFGLEFHFRRFIGIFRREGDIDLVVSTFVGRVFWSLDVALPVVVIVVVKLDLNSGFLGLKSVDGYCFCELLELFLYSQLIFFHYSN